MLLMHLRRCAWLLNRARDVTEWLNLHQHAHRDHFRLGYRPLRRYRRHRRQHLIRQLVIGLNDELSIDQKHTLSIVKSSHIQFVKKAFASKYKR